MESIKRKVILGPLETGGAGLVCPVGNRALVLVVNFWLQIEGNFETDLRRLLIMATKIPISL